MSLSSLGALGMGSALGSSLSNALKIGEQYQQYQADGYNDASNQIAKYQQNATAIAEGRRRQLEELLTAEGHALAMQQPRLGVVDPTAQTQVAQQTLGATLANDPTVPQQAIPQQANQQYIPLPPQQQTAEENYAKYLRSTNGNIHASLQGVVANG